MAENNRRWQALIMIVFVFALGFAAGGLTVNLYRSQAETILPPPPSHHPPRPDQSMERLVLELNLEPNQEAEVRKVLAETRQAYADLRREIRPRFRSIRDESRARIRQLLSPEQQARFDELVRRHDEMYKNRGNRKD